ncbi:MAG: hypothetical protein Q9164_006820 [Protoblastenia rupestris]
MLQKIRHENFVAFLESFQFQERSYAILEHILNGLAYLTSKGLIHGALACSNVNITATGWVKITNQEHCSTADPLHDGKRDLRAVGRIAMELMQKYSKDDNAVGVKDLDRWPSSSKAVGFLSDTTSAVSVKELIQVGALVYLDYGLTSLASSHRVSLAGGRAEVDGGIGRGVSPQGLQVSTVIYGSFAPSRVGMESLESLIEMLTH